MLTWSSTPSTVISPKRLTRYQPEPPSQPYNCQTKFLSSLSTSISVVRRTWLWCLYWSHRSWTICQVGWKKIVVTRPRWKYSWGHFLCQRCHHQVTRVSLRQGLSMLARMGRCVNNLVNLEGQWWAAPFILRHRYLQNWWNSKLKYCKGLLSFLFLAEMSLAIGAS